MRSGIITIVVVTSLLAVGLFGIMGINMTDYNGQYSCPIAALWSNNCSPSNGPLAEAFHHISGLQNLAQSTINTNISFFALMSLLVIAFSLLGVFLLKEPQLQTLFYQRYRDTTESNLSKQQLLCWLALREKRDPQALPWVHDYS